MIMKWFGNGLRERLATKGIAISISIRTVMAVYKILKRNGYFR